MAQYMFFYFLIFYSSSALAKFNDYTLKSISVAFRHGDRTPEPYPTGFYPNDPYKDDPMEPMGHGGLTNDGKKREYQIGTKLRERYNDFLGEIYKPNVVSVESTDFDRTKMSLLLVLAGLFPPKKAQVWKKDLSWQPIPINSLPSTVEGIINGNRCPTFLEELKAVKASKDYQKDVSRFSSLIKNLTIFTGREITDIRVVFHLFHTLTSEKAMNLKLPEWTKPYFPDGPIKELALFEYRTRSLTTKLKKLNGGVLVRKMLNDIFSNKIKSCKKVNLYSVHETTIAGLLNTLNLWSNAVPEYGSAVILETHKQNGKNFLKVVYYKSIPPKFETKIIPGCTEYCPVEKFLSILKDVIPDDVVEACFGPPNNSLLIPQSVNPIVWFYEKLKEWYHA